MVITVPKEALDMYDRLRENLKEKFEYWGQDIKDDDVMDFSEHDLCEVIQNSESFKLFRYMPPTFYSMPAARHMVDGLGAAFPF
ncbi:MAG: hypothetical protein LIO96_00390 [Lachnospiraceae bacterium]|nr:hypothetical protein [Lachnospiraceae bacterium]